MPRLPARDPRGHKGTFGTVAVVGGLSGTPGEDDPATPHMIGGPALAALAALRTGVGLARLAMPEPLLDPALAVAPSATGFALAVDAQQRLVPHLAAAAIDELSRQVSCLAIGPGFGVGDGQRGAVLRAVGQTNCPVVVDADGLNCLCDLPDLVKDFHASAVLTPHVGEFRRLAPHLGISASATDEPEHAAHELAQRLGCIVVLKSSTTVVASAIESWAHNAPNPAMGTAGTGDVLCGIIAGLVAQHFRAHLGVGERAVTSEQQGGISLFDCARAGVCAHSRAGTRWAEASGAKGGMLATDLLELLPGVVESMRAQPS